MKTKRISALLLAAFMVVSLLPMTAFASVFPAGVDGFREVGDRAAINDFSVDTVAKAFPGTAPTDAPGSTPAPGTYAVTNGTPSADQADNHGYIETDKLTATAGDTVTVDVFPSEGYTLKSLSYSEDDISGVYTCTSVTDFWGDSYGPFNITISPATDQTGAIVEDVYLIENLAPYLATKGVTAHVYAIYDKENSKLIIPLGSSSYITANGEPILYAGYNSLFCSTATAYADIYLDVDPLTKHIANMNAYSMISSSGVFEAYDGGAMNFDFTAPLSAKETPIEKDPESDTYRFTMPDNAVTVRAEFYFAFVTADDEHPVNDADTFNAYVKGKTKWKDYTFAGWFYQDNGEKTEFTGGFYDAVPGVTYTARWKNKAGTSVLTDGIIVDTDGIYIGNSTTPKTELPNCGVRFTPAQDGEPATLTLTNASIEAGDGVDTTYSYQAGQELYAGIFNACPLKLVLVGENTVRISRIDANNCAFGISGAPHASLTVTGDSLTVDAGKAECYEACGINIDSALTNSATLTAIGGNGSHSSYGVFCGYLMNTAGTLTGIAGSAPYSNGLNTISVSAISGGKVVGRGGEGSEEYYGLWTDQSISVSHDAILELYGGTKSGTDIKEALYLENSFATIAITENGKIVADSAVKNDGSYDDGYTVTGAQTDIANENVLFPTGEEENIVISKKLYHVRFEGNGSALVPNTCITAAYVTEPGEISREGYAFAGWYQDASLTKAWDFKCDYVRKNTTLYAKWVNGTGTVSGTVEDEAAAPVNGASVCLMRGDSLYAETRSASDGTFRFENVPAGEYQLIVQKDDATTTTLVTVASDGTVTNATLYTDSKTSSVVRVKGNTPDVMVGGLKEVALANKDAGGQSVLVTLEIESKTAESVNADDKQKLEAAAGRTKTLEFIDMTLFRTVGGVAQNNITDTGEGNLLEVVIPFYMPGKANIALYRQHGSDKSAVMLPEGEANQTEDGEYVIIDTANNQIRAYLRYFSTYAIGYHEPSAYSTEGGSSISSYYTVKFETNGGSAVKSVSVKKDGTVSEPTAPTKEGYLFTGWYTDKACTTKYNFESKVTKDVTLYAGWTGKNQIILTIGKKEAMVWGEAKTNDVAPIIKNDRTMLPARFVAEALGATVEWNGEERKATITKDNVEILIYIDSDIAYVNGEEVKLDSPAFIEYPYDRTYTPLRFVAENLGATVEWVEETQQVIITR